MGAPSFVGPLRFLVNTRTTISMRATIVIFAFIFASVCICSEQPASEDTIPELELVSSEHHRAPTYKRLPKQCCKPCKRGDRGCTHPGNANQAWCNSRCKTGKNDVRVCPVSHCKCTSDCRASAPTFKRVPKRRTSILGGCTRHCFTRCNTSSCSVTVYKHCGYKGYGVNLRPGSYDLKALLKKGMKNDDVSSIKVHGG